MRAWKSALLCLALAVATPAAAEGVSVSLNCEPPGGVLVRTVLYFGLSKPRGAVNASPVSDLDWQLFLRDVITPRFPQGLSTWEGQGQWRGPSGQVDQERSKVLQLLHPDSREARRAILEITAAYRKTFEQESVLWEMEPVCAAFVGEQPR